MEQITERVRQTVRNHIKERGLTLQDVAERLGTTHASISRILTGNSRLTLDDFSEISQTLGIPMSTLIREAETQGGKNSISENLEQYLCGDPRVWGIFVLLNSPITLESIISKLNLSHAFVSECVERLEREHIVYRPGPGFFQLTDHAKDISLGKTKDFYELKSKLYSIQGEQTYQNLSRGKEYWSTRDDQLRVVKLTHSQVLAVAKQIESLTAQLRTMDDMNETTPSNEDSPDRGCQLQTVFLALKPVTPELLQSLIHSNQS